MIWFWDTHIINSTPLIDYEYISIACCYNCLLILEYFDWPQLYMNLKSEGTCDYIKMRQLTIILAVLTAPVEQTAKPGASLKTGFAGTSHSDSFPPSESVAPD